VCTALVILMGAQPGFAQEGRNLADLSIEELLNIKIDVSSTSGETILESSSAVTVIDRAMIEQFSFRDVAEALQMVAGISVSRSYLLQGMITSRGLLQELYANKNLLLIDGIPTWHAITGESRPERIQLNDIERIEILKGPASVLYGSQAFTSAINIVTRTAKPGTRSFESYATGGGDGLWGVGGSYRATTLKGLQLSLGMNQNHSQRIDYDFLDETGVRGTVHDYADATNVTAKVSYAGHSVFANAYDVTLGSFGSNPSFGAGAGTPQLANGLLTAYQFDRTFKSRMKLLGRAFYDRSYREFRREPTNNVYSPIRGYRAGGAVRVNYGITDRLNLEVGSDFDHRHADEATSRNRTTGALVDGFVDQHVSESSAFTQLDWKPGSWRLIGGTRFTSNSIFGSNVSMRGTASRQISSRQTVKLVAGQSYRAPSLFELFTATPNITGNPAVRPETSDSFDLVYQYTQGGVYLQAVAYYAQYDSKIFRERGTPPPGVPNPAAPAYYINGDSFSAVGYELEAKYLSARWGTYFVNADVVRGDSGDLVVEQPTGYENYNFRYVPRYNISSGASKQFGRAGASAVITHTPGTNGPFGAVSGWQDLALNLFVEHRVNGVRVRHTFSGRNVLDSDIAFPEFSRRRANVNEVPFSGQRTFAYQFSFGS
jgi:outer membrane cobalamin receptor